MKKAIKRHFFAWPAGNLDRWLRMCLYDMAPHTSNWDFIVGKTFYTFGRNASFD